MYTSIDPTLSRWYQNHHIDSSLLTRPPKLYEFQDLDLEEMAFTHGSAYAIPTARNRYTNPNNQRLEWLGDGILKFLVGDALYYFLPDLGEVDLQAMSYSILNNEFLACLSRRLGFHRRISATLPPGELFTDKHLAGTFQAYIGAFYQEVGIKHLYILHDWFRILIEPYVNQLYCGFLAFKNASHGAELRRLTATSPPSSIDTFSSARIPSYYDDSPRKPSRGLRSVGTNDFHIPPRSSSTMPSQHSMGTYSMQLKELTERYRLPMPEYRYEDNGGQGEAIAWNASVYLNGREYGNHWAKNKKDAQHAASKAALRRLEAEQRIPFPYNQ